MIDTRTGLLRAITSEPEDDTVRLAYADYLDAPKYGWHWDRPTYNGGSAEVLPPAVYDELPPGNVYDTAADATDALNATVLRLVARKAFKE